MPRAVPATILFIALVMACSKPAPPPSGPAELLVINGAGRLTAPDTLAAGWVQLSFRVEPGTGGHNLVLFEVPDSADGEAFLRAVDTMRATPIPGTARGGHEHPAKPGSTVSAMLQLDAGRYLLACLVRDSTGHRHANQGEFHWVTVSGDAGAVEPPTSAVEIRLSDFAYGEVPRWPAGAHRLKIVNTGKQDHLVLIDRLQDGKTLQDWIDDEDGTSAIGYGGMTRLGPGQEFYLDVDLPAGEYVLMCLIPDGPSGKSHLEMGMVRSFKVGG